MQFLAEYNTLSLSHTHFIGYDVLFQYDNPVMLKMVEELTVNIELLLKLLVRNIRPELPSTKASETPFIIVFPYKEYQQSDKENNENDEVIVIHFLYHFPVQKQEFRKTPAKFNGQVSVNNIADIRQDNEPRKNSDAVVYVKIKESRNLQLNKETN
jgi:hypothetical protein